MTAREPLGAPATWVSVVDRDGGRCTCTGGCGRRHTPTTRDTRRRPGPGTSRELVGRCDAGTSPASESLLVVPADPTVPAGQAWKLPVTALTTRCPTCATGTRRAATRAFQRARPATAPIQPGQQTDLLALLDPTDSNPLPGKD